MTQQRVQMKRLPGGGYTLDVEDHHFEIELNTDPVQGVLGWVANRVYYVWVDDTRRGGAFNSAAEAKDFVAPLIEQAQDEGRRKRQLEFWRKFAEENLFPAGVPANVMEAMERYTRKIVAGEEPEDDPEPEPEASNAKSNGAEESVIGDEGTPDTAEVKSEPEPDPEPEPVEVAAEVRKAAPRRSRAKSTTSKAKTDAPKRARRTTAKVKTETEEDKAPESANA